MTKTHNYVAVLILLCMTSLSFSQESPSDLFQKDVGTWDVKIKMWTGGTEPEESTGTEVNKMIGDYWLVSNFDATMMGAPFVGHSVTGYDEKTKKYVGTWVDSMTPTPTKMVGSYDPATKTFTYDGEGVGPDGNPMKSKIVTVYHDDGTHTFTMLMAMAGEEMTKAMEMKYSKKQ